jgi:ferredoxin
MSAVINKRKCPAQSTMCRPIQVCPTGAITYIEDANEPLGGKISIDTALCDDCGQCVVECCGDAITLN